MISIRDKELSVQALSCAAGLSHLASHTAGLTLILDALKATFSDSTAWRVRLNVIRALQDILFTNLFLIAPEQRESILSFACEALTDQVVEVREQACVAVCGILRCFDNEAIIAS